MSAHNRQTNPLLLIIVILLCLSSGFPACHLFVRIIYKRVRGLRGIRQSFISKVQKKKTPLKIQIKENLKESTIRNSKATRNRLKHQLFLTKINISPEASKITWTATEATGCFWLTDSLTGWLTDTDHKKYYFNKDGIPCRLVGSM